jgi:hypothetical protein
MVTASTASAYDVKWQRVIEEEDEEVRNILTIFASYKIRDST